MGAAQTGYSPELTNYQMQQPGNVQGTNVQAQNMQAAQTGYKPDLTAFQMEGPANFGSTQAQQYMSPYMQSVVDVQKDEAVRDAQKGQLAQNLGAVRQGTYGGARQLLAQTENQRNLNTQLGSIQAQGLQSAFENAQQQFERDRAAGMSAKDANLKAKLGVQELGATIGTQTSLANLSNEQQARVNNQAKQLEAQGMNADQALKAALANQQSQLTTGQENLRSNLQTQQLGTETDLRTSLANLDAASQSNVQNLAAQLQTQGLNADQAMKAALANQQSELTTGQQNLSAALDTQRLSTQAGLDALKSNQQADLEAQRLSEQSNQFGATQGLAGLAQANQSAQTLANIGQTQQNADAQRLGMQQSTAAQEQALNQQMIDLDYADFLKESSDPYTKLQQYSNLMSGVPQAMSTTTTQSAPAPGLAQQLAGAGLGAYSTYKMFTGG
jgi:hypothetical protein